MQVTAKITQIPSGKSIFQVVNEILDDGFLIH